MGVVKAPLRLQQLLEPVVTAMGYELVGMEYVGQGRRHILRLYIDTPVGVTLDDCSRVSHQVSGILEVEDPISGPYTLEISSPGLDRPLFGGRDFERFIGRKVQVKLSSSPYGSTPEEEGERGVGSIAGRRKVVGVLKGVQGGNVVVEEQGHELVLPLERIEKANLIPEV
ncbi:ribosome maturation factor RimP [Gammaproteobacteria bacterium]